MRRRYPCRSLRRRLPCGYLRSRFVNMILHVLPGDAIVDTFREANIDGEIVVCRECLVVGPVEADSRKEFWEVRERFLNGANPDVSDSYAAKVVREFDKLADLPSDAEVNLWFEYE